MYTYSFIERRFIRSEIVDECIFAYRYKMAEIVFNFLFFIIHENNWIFKEIYF